MQTHAGRHIPHVWDCQSFTDSFPFFKHTQTHYQSFNNAQTSSFIYLQAHKQVSHTHKHVSIEVKGSPTHGAPQAEAQLHANNTLWCREAQCKCTCLDSLTAPTALWAGTPAATTDSRATVNWIPHCPMKRCTMAVWECQICLQSKFQDYTPSVSSGWACLQLVTPLQSPLTFAWQGDALCEKDKFRSDEAARILGPRNHFTWGPETVNINNPDKTLSSSGPPWIITGPHPLPNPIREAPCIRQVRDVSNNKTYSLRIYIIGSTWMIFSVYGQWWRLSLKIS